MAARGAGARTESIGFERAETTRGPSGQQREEWVAFAGAKASIYWGSGSERRQAAQEAGSQAASFVVLATSRMRGVSIRDRITYGGASWDILSIVPRGRDEIEFNAVRAV